MELTRRGALSLAAFGAVATMLPLRTWAETNGWEAAMKDFTGGAEASEGGVDLTAPEIAENGNTVPVSVSAPGATAIMVLSAGNPNPGVAQFNFGALSGSAEASTRIRLAGTQDLVAVAKMADGSFAMTKRNVKVTIGGCGG